MSKKYSFFLFVKLFLLGVFLLCSTSVFALQDGTSTSGKLIEYLAAEKANLTVANSDIQSFSAPITSETFAEQKERVTTQKNLIAAKIETLNAFLLNQRKKQRELKACLKEFKQSSSTPAEAMVLKESVNQVLALLKVNAKAIELISDNLTLAYQYQKNLYHRERQLVLWEAAAEKQKVTELKQAAIAMLEKKRAALYEKNLEIEQHKKSNLRPEAKGRGEEGILFLNNQSALLIDHQIALVRLEMNLAEADFMFLQQVKDAKTTESFLEVYTQAEVELQALREELVKMEALLNTQSGILSSQAEQAEMQALEGRMSTFNHYLDQVSTSVQKVLEEKQAMLKKQRASRQRFEDYKQVSFSGVMRQLAQVPILFYQYLRTLFVKMFDHYMWGDIWSHLFFWGVLFTLLVFFVVMRGLLHSVTKDKERSRFSGHLYDGALLLLYRSLPQLLFVSLVVTSFLLNQVMLMQFKLLFHLFVIWLVYRQLKGVARLVLLERMRDISGHEMILYHRLNWLFLVGSWAIALMILGQELSLSSLLQDIFNRLFMVFLFAVAWVLWKSREGFPELFHPWLSSNKRPFQHLLSVLAIVIPLLLWVTAAIGVLGYIHFAWILARYLAYFLMVVIAYVLLRELLKDLLDFLSERMVSKLHNGWLWVEAILKPLEKWLHFGLFFLGVLVIFRGFRKNWEPGLLPGVKTVGTYPIVSGSGVQITLFSTALSVIVLMILIWLAKWTREFCYRWLYRGVVDAAIRNSISIFTQYTVILLGSIIFLRVLGVDLTGMGMVLGGLAVGMGFGLRDFASNIIGGLMLLIERPVREGDLITLGEYEGRVEHIGIRSMRVSSWDHMDVLIPNAETFNKPVTNWTHQDGVVRTVLPIKVNRADDPNLVRQLIFDVLDIIPKVLKEPPFQVFLKKIDEALVEFEVRYFVNVQFSTRIAVQSEVLLAIMAQFKAAGIQAPIPPFRIEMEENARAKDEPETSPEK